ncbi:MAG TPA: heparinase II/III family protein [Rhodothermales bacterium]|nr:heparinase II/III family protein [Rhodothermales bacterium]
MQFSRREFVRLSAVAAAVTPFSRFDLSLQRGLPRLFFAPDEIARIRANAASPLLLPVYEEWRSLPDEEAEAVITKVLETGDLLYDWGTGLEAIYRQATLALLSDEQRHRDLTMVGLRTLRALPHWDYLLDGGTRPLGIMRASKATTATLLSLEVLGDHVPDELREQLLLDVAEKGCAPCHLTIQQMNNPEEAEGWGVDEIQAKTTAWDMSRWPSILAVNNLRAIPTMGLGLGALALEGRDPRASMWRATASDSARRFLDLFEPDGSYFEGISYVDFAFRTLFLFLEADYRIHGDVDWIRESNFDGVINYIVALQNGRNADGTPDIVNISDSRKSVFTCVPSWIANRSGNPLAAYTATHFSAGGYFADFLWYQPKREGEPPPDTLKNVRMNLGWIVARTGWEPEDTVLSFRGGGPMNHEHADRNSLMLKSKGERLLTEHFGASYRASDPHWLLRLPVAHNAVLVDGQGHQYHNGEEGTNASLASAEIVSYVDDGDTVHWSSDATPAYRLVDGRITLVRRSILFSKPGVVLIVDEVEATEPVSAQVLFHPDNRDELAGLDLLEQNAFMIRRPNAALRGQCYSGTPLHITRNALDLPEEHGVFPYLEASAGNAQRINVLTVLEIEPGTRTVEVTTTDSGWEVHQDAELLARIEFGEGSPLSSRAEGQ